MKKTNSGQFKKGCTPWHKGKKVGAVFGTGNHFKAGHRPWHQADIGEHRRVRRYLQVKVSETGVESKDWVYVHHMVWETFHGPVPKGMMLVFKDRNENNICLENLELISRAENMRRNSIHRLPKNLIQTIMINGKLRRLADGKPARKNAASKRENNRDAKGPSVQAD